MTYRCTISYAGNGQDTFTLSMEIIKQALLNSGGQKQRFSLCAYSDCDSVGTQGEAGTNSRGT
eukprot:1138171-Pelagomonas_calceolata.AAC.3